MHGKSAAVTAMCFVQGDVFCSLSYVSEISPRSVPARPFPRGRDRTQPPGIAAPLHECIARDLPALPPLDIRGRTP